MRVKMKCFLTGAIFVLLMALVVLLAVFTDKPMAASAETTPKYAVAFNYTHMDRAAVFLIIRVREQAYIALHILGAQIGQIIRFRFLCTEVPRRGRVLL